MTETLVRLLFSLTADQVLVGLAMMAAAVAVAVDWRVVLLALAVQYGLVSVLLGDHVLPQVALIKSLVGGFCLLVLYRTGLYVQKAVDSHSFPGAWVDQQHESLPFSTSFRVLALAMWTLGIVALSNRLRFDFMAPQLLFPASWLGGMGLLAIMLTRDPLKTTAALLTFENGFEVLFTPLEPGLLIMAFLGTANIMTALVGAYLTIVANLRYLEPLPELGDWESTTLALMGPEPNREGEASA
ncbi:MAG: hypothetical protein Q9O62_14750 [Ardenticatenia bacterium]|nr:hypothetical protein [Ardenticatenia bacterium]